MTSVENAAAREVAIAVIVTAVQRAAEVLETHGRPGIQATSGPSGDIRVVHGWEVDFPPLDPAITPLTLQLSKPDCSCYQPIGWHIGVFQDGYIGKVMLVAAGERATYQIAKRGSYGYTDLQSPQQFAEEILRDTAVWRCDCPQANQEARITQRAEPKEYWAYVNEVAHLVAETFAAVSARHLSRLDISQENWQARDAAIATITAAIEGARAGCAQPTPVSPSPPYTETILGWRVPLDWSRIGYPQVTPPPRPKYYREWGIGAAARHAALPFVVLTEDGMIALPQENTYQAWQRQCLDEFARWILRDWFVWSSLANQTFTYHMADHTEPGEFRAYVTGVAEVIATGFSRRKDERD